MSRVAALLVALFVPSLAHAHPHPPPPRENAPARHAFPDELSLLADADFVAVLTACEEDVAPTGVLQDLRAVLPPEALGPAGRMLLCAGLHQVLWDASLRREFGWKSLERVVYAADAQWRREGRAREGTAAWDLLVGLGGASYQGRRMSHTHLRYAARAEDAPDALRAVAWYALAVESRC